MKVTFRRGAVLALALTSIAAPHADAQAPRFRWAHGGSNHGIAFVDQNQGVVTRDGGAGLYTSDGGSTWIESQMPDQVRGQLRGVSAQGSNAVWAVGGGGVVLRTINRGQDWSWVNDGDASQSETNLPITNKLGQLAELYDIYMWDEFVGLACGENGALARTTDGWASWTQITLPTSFFSTPPVDPLAIDPVTEKPGDLYRFHAFDSNNVVLATDYGRVLRSSDGGLTWTLNQLSHYCDYTPGKDIELWGMDFVGNEGWMVGGFIHNDGHLWHTLDAGVTWNQVTRFVPPDTQTGDLWLDLAAIPTVYGVAALGAGNAIAVGYGASVFQFENTTELAFDVCTDELTTSSGYRFNQQSPSFYTGTGLSPAQPPLTTVFALDASNAWWCGRFGIIRYSDDQGDTFADQASQMYLRIQDAEFVNAEDGWVVGQSHRIERTEDGGRTWTTVHAGADDSYSSYSLTHLAMPRAATGQLGLAVGPTGSLLLTEDRGETWNYNIAPHTVVSSLSMGGESDIAYIGGGAGTVYRTDLSAPVLGQLDWTPRPLPDPSHDVTAVDFIDASTGYAATTGMTLYRTTNGGTSWTQMGLTGSPTTRPIRAIQTFGDGSKAVAVGDGGLVLVRTGARFEEVNLGALATTGTLRCVEIEDGGKKVFVGGNDGLILEFTGTDFSQITDSSKWSAPKSQTKYPIVALSFDAPDHGFAIGFESLVVEYD